MDTEQISGMFVLGLFLLVLVAEAVAGRLKASRQPGRDGLLSLAGMIAQAGLAGPVIGGVTGLLLARVFTAQAGGWSHWSFWWAFPAFLLLEDFLHYWLHRFSHEWRWLWKLHRTHHSATAMSVGVVFRYNVFWTLLLPQTWVSALLVYMGLPEVFLAVIIVSFTVNVFTHTHFRWDLWLLERVPRLKPLWWQLARVITTPDTHHAHHGLGRAGHVKGNYAVVFFLWDTLFGTGRIPKQEQKQIGLPISGRLHWAEELFWPLVRKPLAPSRQTSNSSRLGSDQSAGL